MSKKLDFTQRAVSLASNAAALKMALEEIKDAYDDRGYGPGLPGAIVDQDVSGLGITADELYAFIIFASQYVGMMTNQPVAINDYLATVNKIRSDF